VDIFFPDPNDPPLPPEEVRLRELRLEPSPDGRRVKVFLELTPFLKRPSAEVLLTGPDGEEAASTSILEAFNRKMEFNLHLPPASAGGEYSLQVTVYYQKLPTAEQPEAHLPEPLVVDRRQIKVNISQT
jgi:hypothetical protein